jgi:histidine triad (HIT) family protein
MSCIFCQIINRQQAADIVFENDHFVVFKDIKPKAPIHLLIVPKTHLKSLNELEDKEIGGEILLLAKKMAKEHNIEDGYKLVCNVGRKGGQIIDHLHFHLLGGWEE